MNRHQAEEDFQKQQAAEQVPLPPPPPAFLKDVLEQNKIKPIPSEAEDKVIAEGAGSDFWKILKRIMLEKKTRLEAITAEKARGLGVNFNEIGFRYLMTDQLSNLIMDLVNFVENRKEAMRQIRETEEAEKQEGADKK